jgi:hypothetical protein
VQQLAWPLVRRQCLAEMFTLIAALGFHLSLAFSIAFAIAKLALAIASDVSML